MPTSRSRATMHMRPPRGTYSRSRTTRRATRQLGTISTTTGDQPITGIALDSITGDLFISTDFGVDMLRKGDTQWVPAAGSLPPVAVYGLTIDSNARVL